MGAILGSMQWLEQLGHRLGAFSEWLYNPEDMEGVASRIASLALIFGGLILVSLTVCLGIYGALVGISVLLGG
ncbi:MAG: hypothetical protein GYB64_09845 [Chloroflexi bacterium]|nr:hypothetical protein [Chloroflexota bacterium]